MSKTALIESVLFAAGEPVTLADLAKTVGLKKPELRRELDELSAGYADRGLRLVIDNRTAQLVTAPESADTLGKFLQEELRGKLSHSALEVLAIVAYRGPVTRPDIERIRGVQSAQPLRTLAIRGLIADVGRKDEPGRPILYEPTLELFKHLGITRREELPEVPESLAGKAAEPSVPAEA